MPRSSRCGASAKILECEHMPGIDLTCADCGKRMARAAGSLPQGKAVCRPCRRVRREAAAEAQQEAQPTRARAQRRTRQKALRLPNRTCGCGTEFAPRNAAHRKCAECREKIHGVCVDCGVGFTKSRSSIRVTDRCEPCARRVATGKRIAVLTGRGVYGQPVEPAEPTTVQCTGCSRSFETFKTDQRYCTIECRLTHQRELVNRTTVKRCRGCNADMSEIKFKHYCPQCRPENYEPQQHEGRCSDCAVVFVSTDRSHVRCPRCEAAEIRRVAARTRARTQMKKDIGRARAAGVPFENVKRSEVYEKHNWTCGICGEEIDPTLDPADPKSLTLDHIVPISRGGAHTYANVQPAHRACNVAKADRLPGDPVVADAQKIGPPRPGTAHRRQSSSLSPFFPKAV